MTGDTWTTTEELAALTEWSKGVRYAAEIGTWTGRSAEAILRGGVKRLFCIDHYECPENLKHVYTELQELNGKAKILASVEKRLKKYEHDYELCIMESMQGSLYVQKVIEDEKLGLVFIDANHSYEAVKRDLAIWTPLSKFIVCGHDYNEPEVRYAVNEFFGSGRVFEGPEKLWRVIV